MDSSLEAEILEAARLVIAQEVRARGWNYNVSEVEMLRSPEPHDLDRDGKEEYYFVAGIPVFSGPAFCGLCVSSQTGGYDVLALHEVEAGFRALFVSDVNQDGVPEVVTLWQEDYGLWLTLHVQQWNGSSVRALFPRHRFHQGLMEMKDLDADGVDEIVVWSGRYESNPRWGPQFFDIHIFRYDGNVYDLWYSHTSERRYLPEGILGQRIGIGGVPIEYERPPSPTEQRRRLQVHIEGNGAAAPAFLEEIGARSLVLKNEGFYDEALETIDIVFEGIGYLPDPEAKLVVSYEAWVACATIYLWVGRWQEAIDAYRKAIDLYDRGASSCIDPQHGATRRRELAFVYYRIGEYGEALRWLSDAEAALDGTDLPQNKYRDELGRIRSASGSAHAELGEYERAKAAFREAIDLHEGLGRFKQSAISHVGLGNATREEAEIGEDDYDEAIGAYENALDALHLLFESDRSKLAFEDAQDLRDRESDVYLELGRALVLDCKFGAALKLLKKSLLLTSTTNLAHHAAVHYLYVGQAYAELGLVRRAENFLSRSIEFADQYGTPNTRWRALHTLAHVQREDGHLTECVETLEKCVETIERLRSQYLPEPTKISMLASKEGPYEDMVDLLCRSLSDDSCDVNARALEHAFGYVERAKSRVFVEQLAGTELGVAELPTDLIEKESRLVRDLRRLQARHRAEAMPLRYDWGAEVAQLEAELRQTRERISRSGPRGSEYVAIRQASPVDYGGVRDLLAEAEFAGGNAQTVGDEIISTGRLILAEYFTIEDMVLLFVGRSDLKTPEVYQIDVSRETTWKWRRLVFEGLRGPSEWDLSEWQNELNQLIEPVGRWAEEDDIVWLVPHGDLHYLPLHALKIQGRYLIERNPVFYTPSASVMKYCESKGSGRRESALVLGDSLGDLKHANEEARTVADLFGVEPYLGNRATKSMITDALEHNSSIDVLHFACHGEFRFVEPLKSCIMLAPTRRDGAREMRCIEDRDLTAEQILRLEMRAELVTLSACESGVSKRHPGDELVGLSRSLIYAGTPSVIVSLWRVNDRSTRLLMGRFYNDWLDENPRCESVMTKARALQGAQQHVMGLAGLEHPYYWSPFILVGAWR